MDSPSITSERPPSADQTRWFAEEVQPNEPLLRAWLRARFPSVRDLDDLVQESYLHLLRAHAAGPIRSAKAFLFTTAHNLAINHLARRRYEGRKALGDRDPSTVLDEGASVPEAVALAQELEMLTKAIQSLPERCREAFISRRLYRLSQKEVAALLGISESTVDAQCIIALRKLAHFFRQADRPAASAIRAGLVPEFRRRGREGKGKAYA